MGAQFSGSAKVAGVVGRPIAHSLSPTLHNAWIAAAGLDAVYVPFALPETGFSAFVKGCGSGVLTGVNVTLPFKEAALAIAVRVDAAAKKAGAANLLLFGPDGGVEARNTDGLGLLYALQRQAPGLIFGDRPVTIIGAGGAARGAVAALEDAGVLDLRILNRTRMRAEAMAEDFSTASAFGFEDARAALDGVGLIINATSAEVGGEVLTLSLSDVPPDAVVMDMLYQPLRTKVLIQAQTLGMPTVDGLDMLIGQAIPSFEALFGVTPPAIVDARALLLKALGEEP